MKFVGFRLMFPREEISYWATRYPLESDQQALDAGRNIREGNYSRSNLEIIVRWKSTRPLALIAKNSADEIKDALRLALKAREPAKRAGGTDGASRFGTPMASAIRQRRESAFESWIEPSGRGRMRTKKA
jgi:hypothetical protein